MLNALEQILGIRFGSAATLADAVPVIGMTERFGDNLLLDRLSAIHTGHPSVSVLGTGRLADGLLGLFMRADLGLCDVAPRYVHDLAHHLCEHFFIFLKDLDAFGILHIFNDRPIFTLKGHENSHIHAFIAQLSPLPVGVGNGFINKQIKILLRFLVNRSATFADTV